MMTIDKLEVTLEKMKTKLGEIPFSFHNADLGSEAETARDDAIQAIETYLELAVQDWESRSENPEQDEEKD